MLLFKLKRAVLSALLFLPLVSTVSRGSSCPSALTLLEIQREAQTHGTTFVVPSSGRHVKGQSQREKILYGAPVIHVRASNPPSEPIELDGVVIHLGDAKELSKYYRGKINLTRDVGTSKFKLEDNKWNEYVFAESIMPGVMPRSVNGKDLIEKFNKDEFFAQEKIARDLFNAYLKSDRVTPSVAETSAIHHLAKLFFVAANQEFPNGAFIKNIAEAQTGDAKDLIRTFKDSSDVFSQKFIDDITKLKKENKGKKFALDKDFEIELSYVDHSASSFIFSLLTNPRAVMVQEKLDVAQIEGANAEVRVNFASGIVTSAETRETLGYMPEQLDQAKRFLTQFLEKIPVSRRKISGGADIVILRDGSIKIIEFNFGAGSGDVDPPTEPISANIYLSGVTGASTVLLDSLESLFRKSLVKGNLVLKGFSEKHVAEKKTLKDSSVVDIAEWLRDRYMKEWKKNPTDENGLFYLAQLKNLLVYDNPAIQEKLDHLYSSAKQYMIIYKLGVTENRFQYQYTH